MELVLIRHGQPEWTRDSMSVLDPVLTDEGHRQAELIASHLAASVKPTTELVVSPLIRAQQTAAPIAAALGLPIQTENWLAEISGPDWFDGGPAEQVERIFRESRNRSLAELWDGLPGGESVRSFHKRITEGANQFLEERGAEPATPDPPQWRFPDPDRRIVIVAHAGTNATLIGHLLGIPPVPWEWERFVTFHSSLSELHPIEIGGAAAYSLVRLSDISHLPAHLRTR